MRYVCHFAIETEAEDSSPTDKCQPCQLWCSDTLPPKRLRTPPLASPILRPWSEATAKPQRSYGEATAKLQRSYGGGKHFAKSQHSSTPKCLI